MMMLFAVFVALIFGIVGREGGRDRLFYGLKIFAEFMGVGLGLAWLLYLIPW
jgi:hypothetical protein